MAYKIKRKRGLYEQLMASATSSKPSYLGIGRRTSSVKSGTLPKPSYLR